MYAEVAVPLHVDQTFTYRLPQSFASAAKPGCRVLVPFGSQLVTGYIVDLHESLLETGAENDSLEIKDIEELFDTVPVITEELLELTRWIADYYYAPWGETIKFALPAGINAEVETFLSITPAGREALQEHHKKQTSRQLSTRLIALDMIADRGLMEAGELSREFGKPKAAAVIRQLERAGQISVTRRMQSSVAGPKRQQAVRLISPIPADGGRALTPQQQTVIERLVEAAEPMAFARLTEAAGVSGSVIRTLERRGLIDVFVREVRRDPLAHITDGEAEVLTLTPEQQSALDRITDQIAKDSYAAFLLHGVTGSGKTEIYLRAMRAALERGRTALMLVPEIALTPVFARRLRAHFGDAVAILHSSLSEGERLDEWNRLRRGEARVCIGARSAVFAPLEHLGLIVVDEEQESSYKQDESPRYNGRDTAIMRGSKAGSVVILGSATPSMETFHHARNGKYEYIHLTQRIGGRALPAVELVDMREVFTRHGKRQVFSDEVKSAIAENHARSEQTMVLLNRRGYSSFLLCRSCGHTPRCINCDVALTYHRAAARLICHYCGHQERVPQVCPECSGRYIYYVGEGTEQIEAILQEAHPEIRIARLDRDTTRQRGAFERLLGEFASGSIDLLVGTQMIAKGHDFPNVTLVCVVSVEAGLNLPDFRAAERTFQLLAQVSGRAGRGEKPGRVLIQTYHPEHYAIQYAREQVYDRFYEHEIHVRSQMHYPPFVALINVLSHSREYARAAALAADFAKRIREADTERALRVLGPAPAPLSRLRGEHRLQMLIKTHSRRLAREAIDRTMEALRESKHDLRMLMIDMDPTSLM